MRSEKELLDFLDGLSPEDRNTAIGMILGQIPQPAEGLMIRTTVTISKLGTPEELQARVAKASGFPVESIPLDVIDEQRKAEDEKWRAVAALIQPYRELLDNQEKVSPDKYEELNHVGRFLVDSGENAVLVVPEKPTLYPDFLLRQGNELVGLEHTRLIREDVIPAVKLAGRLIANARQLLVDAYPEFYGSVNVFIDYNRNRKFTRAKKKQVAQELAAYIYSEATGGGVPRPPLIAKVSYVPNPEPRLDISLAENYLAKEGFGKLLRDSIMAKEKRTDTYRAAASLEKCWLLVVLDGVSSYSGFDLQTVAFQEILESNFERIFLLEAISHRVRTIFSHGTMS